MKDWVSMGEGLKVGGDKIERKGCSRVGRKTEVNWIDSEREKKKIMWS